MMRLINVTPVHLNYLTLLVRRHYGRRVNATAHNLKKHNSQSLLLNEEERLTCSDKGTSASAPRMATLPAITLASHSRMILARKMNGHDLNRETKT